MVTLVGNNPGIEFGGDELSASQETTLKSLADLSFQNGDIVYYNNGALQRLAAGSNTNILNLSSGIPAWKAEPLRTQFTAIAAGTVYSLTNTAALIDFGTTDPAITITSAGTYLIMSGARVDYNAATFAAVRTGTLKLRRTNNTAADLTGTSHSFKTQIITLLTFTAIDLVIPSIIYTTSNSDDIIQMWGSVDTVPSAGSLDVAEAYITAIKLY